MQYLTLIPISCVFSLARYSAGSRIKRWDDYYNSPNYSPFLTKIIIGDNHRKHNNNDDFLSRLSQLSEPADAEFSTVSPKTDYAGQPPTKSIYFSIPNSQQPAVAGSVDHIAHLTPNFDVLSVSGNLLKYDNPEDEPWVGSSLNKNRDGASRLLRLLTRFNPPSSIADDQHGGMFDGGNILSSMQKRS